MVKTNLKHDLVAEKVREWLLSGRYKQGEKLPTDEDLASHFLVNKRTVAQGLNKLAAEDLLQRAPKLGTIVKRSIVRPLTNSVGFLTLRDGEIYADTAAYCDELLLEHGLFPIQMDARVFLKREKISSYLERMTRRNKPYGFLMMGESYFPYEQLIQEPERYSNTIFIFRYHAEQEIPWCRYVLTDYKAMGRMIVEYFAAAGVKRILFPALYEIAYQGVWSSLQKQLSLHIKDNLKDTGIVFDDELFDATLSGTSWNEILPDRLRNTTERTGIFGWSDYTLAYEINNLAKQNGIDLFKNFTLLGNFNTKWAEDYGIDTFDIQAQNIMKVAVDMLTGADNRQKVMIPPLLIKYNK
ncbi:MAG: GntR family transcriptional regulator [Lentisphaeria bacterium]|nr:GntR family transcriptional regulator [Lentisphaeria bacterium]